MYGIATVTPSGWSYSSTPSNRILVSSSSQWTRRQRLADLVRPEHVEALLHELLAVEGPGADVQVVDAVVGEAVERGLQVLGLHGVDVALHRVVGLAHCRSPGK
jgi:hypothetical protein